MVMGYEGSFRNKMVHPLLLLHVSHPTEWVALFAPKKNVYLWAIEFLM